MGTFYSTVSNTARWLVFMVLFIQIIHLWRPLKDLRAHCDRKVWNTLMSLWKGLENLACAWRHPVCLQSRWSKCFVPNKSPRGRVNWGISKSYSPSLGWSNHFHYSSTSLCVLLTESSWRRTSILCISCNFHWHLGRSLGNPTVPTTASHDAAYTPANTVWHLIYHQSIQVNVSKLLISLLDLSFCPLLFPELVEGLRTLQLSPASYLDLGQGSDFLPEPSQHIQPCFTS